MQDISQLIDSQHSFFMGGQTRDISFRIEQLKKLHSLIKNNQQRILDALHSDFRKSAFEGYVTEIGLCLDEIGSAIKRLRRWAKPKRVGTPLAHFPSSSRIHYEPYGVTLIISPWNYPFNLLVAPLTGAIAAGNCVVLKPSEYAPAVSKLMCELVQENFNPHYIACVEGAVKETQALLEQKLDYIFFTGGTRVGQIVMEKAAKRLTPVTLELGGKSPCIVDADVHLDLAAKRIVWGKFVNAGQTCIAPDYILAQKDIKQELLERMARHIKDFYGEDAAAGSDYPRIITDAHFERLKGMFANAEVYYGGNTNDRERYIEPTILNNVNWDDPVMQEEIFGPVLPVLEYDDLNEAITAVNRTPKPLALYIFSDNAAVQKKILNTVQFGGGCINDTLVHFANPNLPFGGIGNSGIGGYHGYHSFLTFSHQKSVLKKSVILDLPFRYPPYTEGKLKMIKLFVK